LAPEAHGHDVREPGVLRVMAGGPPATGTGRQPAVLLRRCTIGDGGEHRVYSLTVFSSYMDVTVLLATPWRC